MALFSNSQIRIVLTGGGTGGHIFPLLAVADELRELSSKYKIYLKIYYVGPISGPFSFSPDLFENKYIEVVPIKAASPSNASNPLEIFKAFFNNLGGFFQALWQMWRIMPDAVFSKGGYGSLSVSIVSFLYLIPVLIHESDSIPGKTNLFLKNLAKRIAISFEKSASYFPLDKTALVGNPTRKIFFQEYDKNKARSLLKVNDDLPIILILGGSQGARRINSLILDILPLLVQNYYVIHQCGEKNYQEVKQESQFILKGLEVEIALRYKLHSLLDEEEMVAALEIANLVVARSGSGTIFEIAAKGKPAILIPLSTSASNHQLENALEFAKNGGAIILEEENLKSRILLEQINILLNNKEKLREMALNSRKFSKPEASLKIAQELLNLAKVNLN